MQFRRFSPLTLSATALSDQTHRRSQALKVLLRCLGLLAGLNWVTLEPGAAVEAHPSHQAPIVSWSEPRIAWETTGRTSNPTLVTDAWGQVHLFFVSQGEGEGKNTLFHANADNPDAEPVDVLIGVNEYRVAADPYGQLHVLALGAANSMIYTSVDGTEAGNASAWSASETLGAATLGIDITADASGALHICYPQEHAAVYQRSEDGGRGWKDPTLIADMVDPSGIATYVRCAVDSAGTLHSAWAEASPPNFYPPDGVYYARSLDSGQSWTAPESIAGQHYSLPTLLADLTGRVHLFWQGDVAVGGRYYRQRLAGEAGSWGITETVVPAGNGGMSGDAFLAVDSQDTVHVGMTIDGIHWAARRTAWSAPLELSGSLRDLPNTLGSIEQAALAIANGNEIYVAFEFDFKRIYLMTGQSNAPAAARTPLSVATATVDPALAMTTPALPGTVATPTPPLKDLADEALAAADQSKQRSWPTILAATMAFLVVGVAFWLRRRSPQR